MADTTVMPTIVLMVGILIVLSLMLKALFVKMSLPPLVGWIFLGIGLSYLGEHTGIMTEQARNLMDFLGKIGVIMLLFSIGIESDLRRLLGQIRFASVVWLFNVIISGLFGYLVMRYYFGYPFIPCLTVGIAMTATSIGVSAGSWGQAGKLKSTDGQLLLDIAEMDDISSIILMGIVFAVLPSLAEGISAGVTGEIAGTSAVILGKIAAFIIVCMLFSRYLEKPLTSFILKTELAPDPMLSIIALGVIIAAIAALLGFSVAMGAFFAGLAFSRDEKCIHEMTSYKPLVDLFSPFFFIGIGFGVDVGILGHIAVAGLVLFAAASLGKIAGVAVPALLKRPFSAALLLGVSMVPRAEITMIILEFAHKSPLDFPDKIYAGMVMTVILTCTAAPLVIRRYIGVIE